MIIEPGRRARRGGRVATQSRPRLGTAAAVIAWLGFANLAFLITPDQAALAGHDAGLPTATTAAFLSAIDQNPVATAATTLFVTGHILGIVLLGVALWQVIPRWAAIALIVSQPLHFVVAVIVPNHPLDVLAWLLTTVGFTRRGGRGAEQVADLSLGPGRHDKCPGSPNDPRHLLIFLWRCRESNPGPPLLHEGFSVRSPPCLYSDPPVMRTSRCDDPSRCLVSLPTPRPGGQVSPLDDAGNRVGNAPGPTARYWIRRQARTSRAWPEPGQCAYQRHLLVYDAWLTRSSSSSSARFPSIDIRSRNRSPPSAPVQPGVR